MKKISAVLLGALPLATLLAACGGEAQSDHTQVVASFYPFAYVAEQVGGSRVHVENLTSPGVEPHDIELKPKQVGAVQKADLVIYEHSFQSAVDQAVDQAGRADDTVVDVAKLVRIQNHDPHTWLDPHTMIAVTKAVEARLSDADPDHATSYAARARALEARLTTLDADYVAGLKTCRTRTIVTSHAAFHYLSERYGLTQVAIAGLDPTNEPAPSQLARISALVKREHIKTIFTEELVSPAVADTIARETGARTATLDPIEGLSNRTRGETYLTLMRHDLEAIRKANSCT